MLELLHLMKGTVTHSHLVNCLVAKLNGLGDGLKGSLEIGAVAVDLVRDDAPSLFERLENPLTFGNVGTHRGGAGAHGYQAEVGYGK